MKIVHVIPTLYAGGAETLVKDYSILLKDKGCDIIIIVIGPRCQSILEDILKENGIKVFFLDELLFGENRHLNRIQKLIKKISKYLYFRKIIKTEKPDIVHSHLGINKYLLFLPKQNMKLFHTVHNIPERFFDTHIGFHTKHKEYLIVRKLIKKKGMKLIALHENMKFELEQIFKTNQVFVINNGVDLKRFHKDLYNTQQIRSELKIQQDEFVIGHVGRFNVQKNHEFIIEVFKNLVDLKTKSRLLLVGFGTTKEKIVKQLQEWGLLEKVIFLENRLDIPELMSIMDVFFFPSKWEGFGNVLIEAQSMDIPCIVSDKVPKETALTDNIYQLKLEEPIENWCEAILNTPVKKAERNKLDEYDIRKSVDSLYELYK